MRRPVLLGSLLSAVALLLARRSRSARAERDLWTEATAEPDLR
jgi:hypothetical protein